MYGIYKAAFNAALAEEPELKYTTFLAKLARERAQIAEGEVKVGKYSELVARIELEAIEYEEATHAAAARRLKAQKKELKKRINLST